MWFLLICFGIGAAFGVAMALLIMAFKVSDAHIRHHFRRSTMPKLDIDESLLEGGREDKAIEDYKDSGCDSNY